MIKAWLVPMVALPLALAACGSTSPGTGTPSGAAGGSTGAGGGPSGSGGSGTPTGAGGAGRGGAGGQGTGGATATGGASGTGGAAGAGAGGSTGAGGAATGTGGAAGVAGATIWPNPSAPANSDPFLSQHHDQITQLQPVVLLLNFSNAYTMAQTQALVDKHVNVLKIASSPHRFKDATAQPALAYNVKYVVMAGQAAKPVNGTSFNYAGLNTQAFADNTLKIADPANPGTNLTLCQLFEKGIIHEVWCMVKDGENPKCGETQESKQVYDANNAKVAGKFISASNGDNIVSLGCKVTTRITDFNPGRGTGCHQHALGHGWERYMGPPVAVPALVKQASRFLNWDMDTRLMAPFSNFYSACSTNSAQTTDCMVWQSTTHIVSGPSAAKTFDIADMSGGCGNAHFYPNTTGNYSYDATTPDPNVLSSCENYGLHNGPGGKDLTTPFTNAMTDTLFGSLEDDDCGGHGTAYIYENFPGPGTLAKNDDGTPMHNWWVYLFY
jgi:hypothetical protein